MYQFSGRFVYLEELTTKNDRELFELMLKNQKEYCFYVSDTPLPQNYDEFKKQLKTWFSEGRNFQFLAYIKNKSGAKENLIGTIFFYSWNKNNESIKISAYFIPEFRNSLFSGESLGASILFVKEVLGIKKLYFDCYKENKEMINLGIKIGAKELGTKRSNINPEREIISFIVQEEELEKLAEKITKFENREIGMK